MAAELDKSVGLTRGLISRIVQAERRMANKEATIGELRMAHWTVQGVVDGYTQQSERTVVEWLRSFGMRAEPGAGMSYRQILAALAKVPPPPLVIARSERRELARYVLRRDKVVRKLIGVIEAVQKLIAQKKGTKEESSYTSDSSSYTEGSETEKEEPQTNRTRIAPVVSTAIVSPAPMLALIPSTVQTTE